MMTGDWIEKANAAVRLAIHEPHSKLDIVPLHARIPEQESLKLISN